MPTRDPSRESGPDASTASRPDAASGFFSSFEAGDPPPLLAPTTDGETTSDGAGGGAARSSGTGIVSCVVDSGPTTSPTAKPLVGFSGTRALRFDGELVAEGRAQASCVLFDVELCVTPETELSYVLFPHLTPGDPHYASTYAAVDLAFADGTRLSQLGARDQHGAVASPRGQGDSKTLSADQWNAKRVALGTVAAGRTITGILLAYDGPPGPGSFRGWVDDIRVDTASVPEHTGGSVRPSDLVLTTRGTNSTGAFSRGNNIPATAVPHGFNFWVPVTDAGSTTWLYEYQRANNADNRPELQAFALSHETSPWMGDRQTFQVMPSDREGTPDADRVGRALAFGHENEIARPHHYAVTFDNGLRTEIAPTDHAAMFRFTFTADTSTLVFNNVDRNAGLTLYADGVVTGYSDVRSRLSNGATRMFVYATFDRPVVSSGRPTGADDRAEACAYMRFDTSGRDKTVTMRIATSLISVEQARANLALELPPGDTFNDVRDRARQLWDDRLSVIEVEGASHDQLVTLYSNLYRLFLYPNFAYENTGTADAPVYAHAVQSSVTTPASTPTATGAQVLPGKVHVNNGFWDTYRTTWPAYALLTPRLAGEFVDGFLQQYRDGGWVSRWSSPGYANLMVGTSSDVAFADAYLKGVEGFDVEAAYDAAVKNATVCPPDDHVGRKGFDTAVFLGYTAEESTHEAMSWALDGYINDFGIAMMAKALAERARPDDPRAARYREEFTYFLDRALGYVHLFDPSVGFFQGRRTDGSWRLGRTEFDPRVWGFDYTETNAWNMAFHVPHDGRGLANLYGGRDQLARKLDEFFATPETGEAAFKGSYGTVIHEMTEARDVRMGMYGHSNQPAHHIAYMYDYAGQPAKAQEKVREVLARLYLGSEIGQGYPGDEDNGEMSAWQVLSALGFYPLQMGSPFYAVGSPLFTRATVHLENGNDLVVSAPGNSPDNVYVQGLTVNGEPWDRTYLPHDLLAAGAVLEFAMGPTPSAWGTEPAAAPPSITTDDAVPAPRTDVTGSGVSTASEGVDVAALVDNRSATGAGFGAGPPHWVQHRLDTPRLVDVYTLTSDALGGDPAGWRLLGSSDGETWDLLDERTDEEFRWRRQTRPFAVARPGAFAWYRLEFTGGPFRLAEIELLARPTRD